MRKAKNLQRLTITPTNKQHNIILELAELREISPSILLCQLAENDWADARTKLLKVQSAPPLYDPICDEFQR